MNESDWFMLSDDGQIKGPYGFGELEHIQAPRDTLVRRGSGKWMPLFKAVQKSSVEKTLEDEREQEAMWERIGGYILAGVCALFGIIWLANGAPGGGIAVCIGIWLICGFIARAIARAAGMDPGIGFLLGFLLGPLGVIVAFVMLAVRSKPPCEHEWEKVTRADGSQYGRCAKCGERWGDPEV